MQYTIEKAFWANLGWHSSELTARPRKQVQQYMTIMQLEAKVANDKMREAQANPSVIKR